MLFDPGDKPHIPDPFRADTTHYLLDRDYEKLYRRLTNQPLITKPVLGETIKLPPRERKQSFSPPDSKASKPSKPWNVPYQRNPWFTGREALLENLRQALTTEGASAISQTQAIAGLGGVGKTQTAVEYAYRHRDSYDAVFWTPADTEVALSTGFLDIARLLDLPEKDAQDLAQARDAVKRWLASNDGWLLVFDNADAPELVEPFLPPDRKGHVLLTSRARVFHAVGIRKPQELEQMEPKEAKDFLLDRTERKNSSPGEVSAAEELAKELGYFPLALEQAGAYMVANDGGFRDYLTSLRTRGPGLLEKHSPVAGGYSNSVATTWALNFAEVEKTPAAAELLRVTAFLAPDDIPHELITKGASELGPALSETSEKVEQDPLVLDEVLEPLTRYSLIRRDIPSRTYNVHRLVQAVTRDGMDGETQRATAERAVRAVNQAFPSVEFENWSECERLLPHALACAQLIEQYKMEFEQAARLLNQTGLYLHERADYREAEPLYQRSLAIWEKALGPDHPDVALSLNNLAALYDSQGRYADAEPLYRRALAIDEKALGADHPGLATDLNNLAALYDSQGRYREAEPLYQRSLAIREKAFGPDHSEVATSLNNLALLYKTQRRYKQAEALYQRALAIDEKALAADHPDVGLSLNNLALLHHSQGRYAEAEPLYQRALAILEKALGPEHPTVATILNNLAGLFDSQGRYGEAEPLYQRSLAIREKVLGPEHPLVATSLNNLAGLYHAQGRYTEAEPLFQRALAIVEKALGRSIPIRRLPARTTPSCCGRWASTPRPRSWRKQAEKPASRSRYFPIPTPPHSLSS